MHNKVDWEQVKQIVIKAVKTLVIKVKEFFRGMRTNIANVIKIATTAFKSSNFDNTLSSLIICYHSASFNIFFNFNDISLSSKDLHSSNSLNP